MKISKVDVATDAPPSPERARTIDFPVSPDILPGVAKIADIAVIMASGMIVTFLTLNEYEIDLYYKTYFVIFVSFIYVFLADKAQLFSVNAIVRPLRRADDIAIAITTAFLFFLSFALALDASSAFTPPWLVALGGTVVTAVVATRLMLAGVLRAMSLRGLIGRSMVVFGVGEQSRRFLARFKQTQPYLVAIMGVYGAGGSAVAGEVEGFPVLGDVDDLLMAARERRIDDVLVAMPWSDDRQLAETIERLKELPVNVMLSTDLIGFELAFRPALGHLAELPMFEVVQRPISGWSSALKVLEDYVLASLILLVISPVMLLIALAIKLDSPGPVFFMQKRLGFNNKEFLIYKFRSMYWREVPEKVVRQATRGDPRVTRVGRVIRATSLDELPQLLNVLNGTMSLVGPRPHAVSHNEEYGRQIRGYFARHKVKPGITGWAQVNGLRGETDVLEKMQLRIQHDIYYTDNWSLLFDLKILIKTAFVAFFQKTAY